MSEKKKAIHMLQSYAGMTHKLTDNQGRPKLDQAIEIVLNLLEEQDNRIKELEAYNYECNNIIRDYIEELEFKDKLIDAMLEVIEECRANDCLYSDEIDLSQIAGTEQIKQYFENLAKESGEIDECN